MNLDKNIPINIKMNMIDLQFIFDRSKINLDKLQSKKYNNSEELLNVYSLLEEYYILLDISIDNSINNESNNDNIIFKKYLNYIDELCVYLFNNRLNLVNNELYNCYITSFLDYHVVDFFEKNYVVKFYSELYLPKIFYYYTTLLYFYYLITNNEKYLKRYLDYLNYIVKG